MTTKTCSTCKETKEVSEFNSKNKLKGTLQPFCRSCGNEYTKRDYHKHKEAYAARKRKQVAENKTLIRELKSIPCTDCGISYPYYVMDFDHLRDKECNLSSQRILSWSKKRILEEVAKCEIVCANCHRERTFNKPD